MNCPKCGGKALVTNTLHSDSNETYRKHRCVDEYNCGHVFWSIEYEVEENQQLYDALYECGRMQKQMARLNKLKGEKL